jgi:hypothetical protein
MARKFTFFFLLFTIALLWMCGDHSKAPEENTPLSDTLMVERMVYPELTAEERKLKLAECASCHPQEHHNEMIGPHSQSYSKLLEHMGMAESSPFFPRPYHRFVTDASEKACVTCHAAKNLYETSYYGLDTLSDVSFFSKQTYPDAWQLPTPRPVGDVRLSGIDCLTCHQKGDRMVTTVDFVRNPEVDAPCNPIASKFFSSNDNCIACHKITNEGMKDNLNNPTLTQSMSCNGCHMEKDGNSFTHYYYWRHDAKEKEQHPLLKATFDDVQLTRSGRNSFRFIWNNSSAPHRFSECAELYVTLDFLNTSGKLCKQFTKRLNNKVTHDSSLQSYFGDEPIWGEVGCSFLPDENGCQENITFECENLSHVVISGYEKPQYWISDSLAQKVYSKTVKL